jgi:hypothetical protein
MEECLVLKINCHLPIFTLLHAVETSKKIKDIEFNLLHGRHTKEHHQQQQQAAAAASRKKTCLHIEIHKTSFSPIN